MSGSFESVLTRNNIVDAVMEAGIAGAGGAGFPTHVKLDCSADIVVANGAECEPLIETDRHLMLREPGKVIEGLKLAMKAVGAQKGIIAIKEKHQDITGLFKELLKQESGMELKLLENFYPAGDEHVLVHETTGRTVPMGGIPPDAGVVAANAYTLALVADSIIGIPFTHRYVTITGEVGKPCVAKLPLGISIRDAVEKAAGGFASSDYSVILGGPMMGKLEVDIGKPVVKTTGAILVLPSGHSLVQNRNTSLENEFKKAKSVCCQCNFCTEMCPRFLLGHNMKPHKLMRLLSGMKECLDTFDISTAALCCECGLCGSFACTMGLSPNKVNAYLKSVIAVSGNRPDFKKTGMDKPNSYRQMRKVPVQRLLTKLGLSLYNRHLPLFDGKIPVSKVTLPLKQHIGAPAVPLVSVGDFITAGMKIAAVQAGKIGANLHSPINGKVVEISDSIIIENELV